MTLVIFAADRGVQRYFASSVACEAGTDRDGDGVVGSLVEAAGVGDDGADVGAEAVGDVAGDPAPPHAPTSAATPTSAAIESGARRSCTRGA